MTVEQRIVFYIYDDNGNLINDATKGITNISYNDLNLPTRVTFTGGRNIEFVYDANGIKLSKRAQNGPLVTLTEYSGNYVYVKVGTNLPQLQYISQPEGYVSNNNGTYSYVYQYADHLGNIRLSYTDTDKNGIATSNEIIEENNYYPFGLKHKGYNNI
ncbi:MAG: RHS repeat-associated core domain-containing protein, partial [Pedobacter sp.]